MSPTKVERSYSDPTAFDQAHELAGIEALRFLCAFTVLIWHYQHFFFIGAVEHTQALNIRPILPAYWILQFAYEKGWWAVQIFWCISGYIFFCRYAQKIFDRRIGAIEFATRRFSRLYPLHIVTLALVAVLQYVYFHSHGHTFIVSNNSAGAFLSQLLLASSWFDWQAESFNVPIWSVSVEILVYFGFFYTMRALRPNAVVAIAVSTGAFALLYGGLSLFHMQTVCECAALFFAGGAAQLLSRRRFVFLGSVCVGTAVSALIAVDAIHMDLGVFAILAACLVLSFARFGEMKSGSILRRFAFLGNATYASYLMHFPIQLGMVIFLDAVGFSRTVFFSHVALVVYLAVVIGISLAVFHLFELPAQGWLRSHAFNASWDFGKRGQTKMA